jgi:mannose-1-phosphate guanylyltransferase / phosphomannomutase
MTDVVILAGGKGTRLKKLLKNKSKCLAIVNKKTILEKIYFILNKQSFNSIYIIINKTQTDIVNFIQKKKLHIKIIFEDQYLGDGGALSNLKIIDNFRKKKFIIINGDLLINFNFKKFLTFHKKNKSQITLTCHPNDHPYDSDLLVSNKKNELVKILSKPHKKSLIFKNLASAGIFVINGQLIKSIPNKKQKFNDHIIPFFLKNNSKIYIYRTIEFVKDIGTVNRIKMATKIEKSNKFKNSLKKNSIPAIFLDRDGVINEEINYTVEDPTILLPKTLTALKFINKSEYLSIIITNQPSVAKGFIKQHDLEFLHNKLETKLGMNGVYIDDIFYCPHHPQKGFKGEIKKFKIICNCRKPKIGLVLEAIKKYNINLKKSYFIGNSASDYLCAKQAQVKYINISKSGPVKNLLDALKSNKKLATIT